MKKQITVASFSLVAAIMMVPALASAATSPTLGAADSFSILSGTYSNSTPGTTINGDVGYTTPPATTPTINGTTHVADSTYNQAGIDQGTALSALNSQPCTTTFAPGAIDLASDTTHGVIGVYTPGVYCITGPAAAASIGGGGTMTLSGAGTYIFRMPGALNTSAGSVLALTNGASVCDVWWTPGAATTLGANSTFGGTVIDASGITIGSLVIWNGRALAFGGTVSTDSDTISSSACAASSGNGPGNSTTGTSASVPKTPGLPNTGKSDLSQPDTVKNLLILGIVASSLLVVRAATKRA